MRRRTVIWLAAAVLISTAACRRGGEEGAGSAAPAEGYTPPPVEYVVGRMNVDDEAAEPSVRMNIAVDPSTPTKDIERLLNYFDRERYDGYDVVWVDVYFDAAKARSPEADTLALVATLRVNRPGFRELKLSEDLLEPEGTTGGRPEVTTQTEETLYLGRRGRMFGSNKQAQTLVDLMEDKPGYAIYRVVWQSPGNTELTYSVEQEMLVRVRSGVSRETWTEMSYEGVKRAARGAGFGGKRRHGANYVYIREAGGEAGRGGE
ncbi:MAG TPA: hypothetical protein VMX79_05655 [bacterium]|nr:hypothetical protein [bacterium]